ncbi:LysR family transcriptional regulator [Swingsia samuiensis]|uniref:LysR family transcriptional regulator n=1 Tax=Swingsia samuiensis TaxID=1293412 RepID=A0A4Y6UK64_9PROT|nr:LysR family transcriptional regulator [Swingsia samuiensis]QDH17190.1 LysR family transcriptional regulator [Swingsia samuiensis]
MRRDEIADLIAFVTVAEEGSFTKAARRLGIAQSGLSQIVRRIEERLGMRLLSRTTRSVAPTEAGERLLATLGHVLHDLDVAVASLGDLRDRPSGTIRVTAVEHAATTILLPKIKQLLWDNPDIRVEIIIDYGLADVVKDRFDAGVRLGGEIAKDMIAVRIGPDIPMAIVGSPDYFRTHSMPISPAQLVEHRAINLRLPTSQTVNGWRVMQGGRETRIKLEGQMILNSLDLIRDAALNGHGLAYLPLDMVQNSIEHDQLVRVLAKFTPDLPGYHLYYPNRRQAPLAFRLFVKALRYS